MACLRISTIARVMTQPMAASSNISTFDNVTQTLKMYDSDDAQILGLTAMLLVADTIALILEQPSQTQLDADKKRKISPLLRLEVSLEVTSKLMEFCKTFASLKLQQGFGR